jgi:hypothetical protein
MATADSVQAHKLGPVVLELAEPLEVEAVEQDEDGAKVGKEVRVLRRGTTRKKTSIWVYIVAGFLGTALVVAIGAFVVALRFEGSKQNEVNARRMSAIHEGHEIIRPKCKTFKLDLCSSVGEEPDFEDMKHLLRLPDEEGIWHIEGFARFDVTYRDEPGVRRRATLYYKVNLKWSNKGWEVVSVSLD